MSAKNSSATTSPAPRASPPPTATTPPQEHDACGVGLVVALDGKPRREVVVAGIEALKAVWHRGAVDADGKTGDGAGIHVADPAGLLRATRCERTGAQPRGRAASPSAWCSCRAPTSARRSAAAPSSRPRSCASATPSCGWRQVPVDISVIGEKANATRPEIEQIIDRQPAERRRATQFERELYLIRRRIEKPALAENITDFYICSLSAAAR